MKSLFDKCLELNSLGISISESFSNILNELIITHNLKEVNPVELEWIVHNEIGMRMAGLYINKVTELNTTIN